MKIKSLLAAVSMVALTAGTASALSIPQTPAMGAYTGPGTVMVPEGAVLANELALPADGIGSVVFSVVTDSGDYPSGNNFIVNIAMPTGVGIDGPVTGSVLVLPAAGSAVVQSQDGSNIQLFVSIPQATATNELQFAIPLELTSCAVSGNLSVTVNTESGTPVEGGTASAVSPIAPCDSGFDTDFDPDALDTVIGLDDYEQLKDQPGGALVLSSIIGLYDAEIDTSVGVDLAGTPLTPASIESVTFDIVLEDGSEVTGITVDGVAGTASTDGNTYSFDLPFTADVTDADIIITVEGDDAIPSQSVTVTNVVHDFTDAGGPDLISLEAGNGGAIDALQREGQQFGTFDWNSGQAGGQTENVYRITGLTPNDDTRWSIVVTQAGAANTVLTGDIASDAAGEAILTASTIASLLPADVKRFDFDLTLETGNSVDVDRLLIRSGVVSAFGDGANSNDDVLGNDPLNDSDN